MAYNGEFYRAYALYLKEPSVRKAHDRVFAMAKANSSFRKIVDLGCGLNEFHRYVPTPGYVGIDLNAPALAEPPLAEPYFKLVKGDYRDLSLIKEQLRGRHPQAFISLFSTEITAPAKENTLFYEQLFQAIPTLQCALVSGFYYANRKQQNPVIEAGEIVSYQTLDSIEDHLSPVFDQFWITLPVPSTMFGDNVVEVWRFLERKQK